MGSPALDAEQCAEILLSLGQRVRAHVIEGRNPDTDRRQVAREGGDAIFAIDRRVEPLIVAAMESLPSELLPAIVVCEGLGKDGRLRIGGAGFPPRIHVLIDPIDGTRSLMYDKRSAWFLAAIAPGKAENAWLSDAIASVAVELPTSKQGQSDEFWATETSGCRAIRVNLQDGSRTSLAVWPSDELSLRNGFGQVASFFPGTKRLAADLMETIAKETLGNVSISEASIFDDQYICTGGQLIELATGKDRFCCDLRPLFYELLAREERTVAAGLQCHPYDMAALLVARKAGVVITDGFGGELDAPFDVSTGVHWCGYANDGLRAQIEPIIARWLRERLGPSFKSASKA